MTSLNHSKNLYNYSTLKQNYNNTQHRLIKTFLRHGIFRNNSQLLLNDIHFIHLLKSYSDKANEI